MAGAVKTVFQFIVLIVFYGMAYIKAFGGIVEWKKGQHRDHRNIGHNLSAANAVCLRRHVQGP